MRLERAKAQMLAKKLPEASGELKALVDELSADPTADPKLLAEHLKGKARVKGLLSGLITHAEVNRSATSTEVWRLAGFWRAIMSE